MKLYMSLFLVISLLMNFKLIAQSNVENMSMQEVQRLLKQYDADAALPLFQNESFESATVLTLYALLIGTIVLFGYWMSDEEAEALIIDTSGSDEESD